MKRNGFTLIELIVAFFVFSVLAVLAGGSFTAALNMQRRALNIKRTEENGRFILELLVREIRVANPIDTGDSGCPGPSALNLQHPVNGPVQYSLSGSQVHRSVGGADTIISNPDIEVSRLAFCVSGNSAGDDKQPRVTIILGLKTPGTGSDAATLDLQTTVSQRGLSD